MPIGVTRFKQRFPAASGYEEVDGPVSGAIVPITLTFNGTGAAGNTTVKYKIDLPPGMRYRVSNVTYRSSAQGGTPTLAVGTVNNATALVATTNLSTNLGNLTVKSASQHLVADSMLIATLTINTTNTVRGGVVTIVGHASQPPLTLTTRTVTHF